MSERILVHEVTLDGYKATADHKTLDFGTWGSYGIEKLHLNLGKAWEGLVILAHFNVKGEVVATALADEDNMIDVPWEALKDNTFAGRIVFQGDMNGARRLTANLNFKVTNHANFVGSDPVPSDDKWNQFVGETKGYRDDAVAAADAAKKSEANVEGMVQTPYNYIDESLRGWLDDHPEATTTLQDGAITEAKINGSFLPWIRNDYVTPEMFGAAGDGQTNDLTAIRLALDYAKNNNMSVYLNKKYVCDGTITVYNNTKLFGNGIAQLINCGINLEYRAVCDGFCMIYKYKADDTYIQDYDYFTISPTSLYSADSSFGGIIRNIKCYSIPYYAAKNIIDGDKILAVINIKTANKDIHNITIENITVSGIVTYFLFVNRVTKQFINSIFLTNIWVYQCIFFCRFNNEISGYTSEAFLENINITNCNTQAVKNVTKGLIYSDNYRFSVYVNNSFVWDLFQDENAKYIHCKSNYDGNFPIVILGGNVALFTSKINSLFNFLDSENVDVYIDSALKIISSFFSDGGNPYIPFTISNNINPFTNKSKNDTNGYFTVTTFDAKYQGLCITPCNLWIDSFKTAGLFFSNNGTPYIIVDGIAREIQLK